MTYAVPQEPERVERTNATIGSPAPLGLSVLAFTTAILGCFYAGFILPVRSVGVRPAVGAFLFMGGIVMILAGMWEYRKSYTISATIFTAYGGFLAALGLIFMPVIATALAGGASGVTLGLIFLCWTIFTGVLFLGTLRTNVSLMITTILLFIAYLLLTIGELAVSGVLLAIGGWVAIVCALFAWLAAIASILSTTGAQRGFRIGLGPRIAAVE